jgi:hypothetical protein
MLHSGYREQTYWWELVVLIRKYFIILLVTFNNRGKFQLHISLAVLILALHLHDSQHPFGHRRDNPVNSILHRYEMSSLLILLFMLWCADFFSLDLCKDDGFSCIIMVVVILLSNFVLVCYLIFMFVRAFCVRNGLEKKLSVFIHKRSSFRRKSEKVVGGGGEQKVVGGGGKDGTNKKKKRKKGRTAKKKRRLSSREVMALEMTNVDTLKDLEKDIIDISLADPMFNPMLEKNNNASNKIKRLPKVVKPKEKVDGANKQEEEKEDNDLHIKILKDKANGRRYSYNKRTGETLWVEPEVKEDRKGEPHTKITVGDGGKQKEKLKFAIDAESGRRYSFNPATGTSLWI